jgi:pyruvate,water dikinase
MSFFAELHGDDARLGGKARSLARLSAAGLRTPAGFVVTHELFRAIGPARSLPERIDDAALAELDRARADLLAAPFPAGFSEELAGRLVQHALWSVRSSFANEDVPGGLGAGVYESRVAVRADEVGQAIRQVLASALSPGAVAYALAHGLRPAAPPLSVLLHPYIRGQAEGGAACAAERADDPIIQVRTGTLAAAAAIRLRRDLRALAQIHGAVEVEWVAQGQDVILLQMRPYEPPPEPSAWHGWDDLEAAGESRASWQWDQAHNPLPLSPVHAGLIALVDQHCRIGVRQRVLGQYLFYAPDPRPGPRSVSVEDAPARFAALCAEVESRLAALGSEPPLEPALELLLAVEEPIFGIIQPALRAARADLEEFLRQAAPSAAPALGPLLLGVESMASERRRRAAKWRVAKNARERAHARDHYLELFGDETTVWDVAFPTCREIPEALSGGDAGGAVAWGRTSFARPTPSREVRNPLEGSSKVAWGRTSFARPTPSREVRNPLEGSSKVAWGRTSFARPTPSREVRNPFRVPSKIEKQIVPARRDEWRRLLRLARQAAGLGEDDDWLYARVQAALRRALLRLGESLNQMGALSDPGDVFFLPLPLVRALAAGAPPPGALAMQAAAGHAVWDAACCDPPPAPAALDTVSCRGVGTGGRALGRVVLHRPGRPLPTPGQILLAPTLLPSELPLLVAAALVTETGGPLDHVATQARERRLPAVVGAAGACRLFREGDLLLVDADRGLVVRLG